MRLIDADELLKYKVQGEIGNVSGDFIPGYAIDNAPTVDAISVVRCKDCNYYVDGCCIIHSEDPDVFSPGYSFNPEPNDFCNYGWQKGTDR